jgi:hypothetical protein
MSGWHKYRLGIMVFIFLFTGLTFANAEVAFQTKVSKLGMGNMDYGKGKSPDETVEVVLPGQWYNPSKKVFVNKLVAGDRNTLEKAFEADIAAMKSDNIEQILASWHPSEREELKRFWSMWIFARGIIYGLVETHFWRFKVLLNTKGCACFW